jgi:glycosyltransferase involved in cell wall biosynthesis
MRIAFYAPLKSPDHPVPSGDRRMAQLFFTALQLAGHEPILASRLRSYERCGDPHRQARIAALGVRIAEHFVRRCRDAPETAPQFWFTYHLYHKAPDWLGPIIAAALGIPYLVAEASHAPKQAFGPWRTGYRAVEDAIRRADAVIGLNPVDRDCIMPLLRHPRRWVAVKPFVDAAAYRLVSPTKPDAPRLITVAMMRHGDKLASYRVLGEALSAVRDLSWSLEVIGDGPARSEVEAALAPITHRVIWSGMLGAEAIAERLTSSDLYVWPALGEAYGMALLEAHASGLPVVAGASGGVSEIVASELTGILVAPGDHAAFAAAVRTLITNRRWRLGLARAARRKVQMEHDLSSAARRLGAVIEVAGRARAA